MVAVICSKSRRGFSDLTKTLILRINAVQIVLVFNVVLSLLVHLLAVNSSQSQMYRTEPAGANTNPRVSRILGLVELVKINNLTAGRSQYKSKPRQTSRQSPSTHNTANKTPFKSSLTHTTNYQGPVILWLSRRDDSLTNQTRREAERQTEEVGEKQGVCIFQSSVIQRQAFEKRIQ